MVPGFYLKYANFGFKMSSQVKSDPAILTGSKKRSWSQNLRSLSQKTKNRGNNALSRRFGRQPFQPILAMYLCTGASRMARPSRPGPCLDFGFQYCLIRNNWSRKIGVEYWALPGSKFAVASLQSRCSAGPGGTRGAGGANPPCDFS